MQGAFWDANHERIERAVLNEQKANPNHRGVIPEWGMMVIAEECASILYEDGVFCDHVRLKRLLVFLTSIDLAASGPYDVYREAMELLAQVRAGKRE